MEHVVLGCGSAEILRMAVDAFAGPRKALVAALPTFDLIDAYAQRAGAEMVAVPLRRDYSHDLDGMRARTDAATGLVYVCNPNNPNSRRR
jgi:histidinol-phosphate aminotransferase